MQEQKIRASVPDEIYSRKLKYHRRNFITFMLEAFLFTGALSMFSPESVLPAYVSKLSEEPIYIALISVIYYGISYGVTIFSCPIGVRAKSPKWIAVGICFLQRVGFFTIFLSTFMAGNDNIGLSLALFFASLALYSFSAGMSNPLFSQMVSTCIPKDVGVFYGAYTLSGSVSGIIGSLILTRCLVIFDFPMNYRMIFLIGLLMAVTATAVVAFGLREVTDDRVTEKISLKEVFGISKNILKENKDFRHFTIVRMLLGAAEFAIPYYIIVASQRPGAPEGFVGMMATIFLCAKVACSLIMGKISDTFGPLMVLRWSCFFGVLAATLAIFSTSWQVSILMYIFLAFAANGILMANNTATVVYSENKYVPIYGATISLLCAPLYIIVSFGGAAIASRFSYATMFALALAVYFIGMVLCIIFKKKDK